MLGKKKRKKIKCLYGASIIGDVAGVEDASLTELNSREYPMNAS